MAVAVVVSAYVEVGNSRRALVDGQHPCENTLALRLAAEKAPPALVETLEAPVMYSAS